MTTTTAAGSHASSRWTSAHLEVSPLVPRLRQLMLFRAGAAVVCLVLQAGEGSGVTTSWPMQLLVTLAWLGITGAVTVLGSRLPRSFSIMALSCGLLADGVYLQAERLVFGGSIGSIVVTAAAIVAVTLLGSLRSGVLLSGWTTLLMVLVFKSSRDGVLPVSSLSSASMLRESLLAVWLVVVTTAAFASVNENELRTRRIDAEVLNALSAKLSTAERASEAAGELVSFLTRRLAAERAIVVFRDRKNLRLLAASGEGVVVGRRPRPGVSHLLDNFDQAVPYRLVSKLNPVDEPWLLSVLPKAHGLVVLPLSGLAEGCWAVIEVRRERQLRLDPRLLSAARQANFAAGLALQRTVLVEQLRRAANTDGLTGLANRRHFDGALAQLVQDSTETGEPLSLAIIDVDHFKRVNDEHGHLTGDEALGHVAAILAGNCRAGDVAARYGGEEFAILMPGTTLDQAAMICERFRRRLAETPSPLQLTASVGVAALAGPGGGDADALLAQADAALLEAKRSGRNRVLLAAPLPVRAAA